MSSIESDNARQEKLKAKLDAEIISIKEHKCYACGQEMHDTKQEEILASKEAQAQEVALQLLSNDGQLTEHRELLSSLGELGDKPTVFYQSLTDAYEHQNSVNMLVEQIDSKAQTRRPLRRSNQ